jgi:hypothetical protein
VVSPLSIKLRCASWSQLSTIYKRDLARGSLFLKTPKPPPIGTMVKIDMTLPSESMIVLQGVIVDHVGEGGMSGRGPGVDIKLATIPQSAMWMIETALASHRPAEPPPAPAAAAPAPAAAAPAARPARAPSVVDAGLDDQADVANAESELVTALGAELTSLQKLNPFQVLGVGYEAGDDEVRAAFGELTKRYHPDRYARYPSLELRRLAAEIFILIRDAYRKIDTAAGRERELAALGRGAVPRAMPLPRMGTGPIARADVKRPPTPALGVPIAIPSKTPGLGVPIVPGVTPGVRKTPAFGAPITAAAPPVPSPVPPSIAPMPAPPRPAETAPTALGVRPNLGGAAGTDLDAAALEALLDEGKYVEALALCQLAARKNPADRVARGGVELAEGLRALAGKDRLEAAQRFENVLEIDPSNERAARELAEMRRMATNERKGLLTKLLGKKD